MRYRIKNYVISGPTDIRLKGKFNIEDLRLIINETQKKVICSSMNKNNIQCIYIEDVDSTMIFFNESVCELNKSDQLTIEVDTGDTIQDMIDSNNDDYDTSRIQSLPLVQNVKKVKIY